MVMNSCPQIVTPIRGYPYPPTPLKTRGDTPHQAWGGVNCENFSCNDHCPACDGTDWWYRPASSLGGPGGWVCSRCHPEPAGLQHNDNSAPIYQHNRREEGVKNGKS